MSAKLLIKSRNLRFLFYQICLQPKHSWRLRRSISSDILQLHGRGLFQTLFPPESSAQLVQKLESGGQCMYCGYDPTADSLHIGNLLSIIALLHCQRAGHKPIALLGGATAHIGDPSGRQKARTPLTETEINKNIQSIASSLERIVNNHEKYLWKNPPKTIHPVQVINNAEWYEGKQVVKFLAEVGQHFRMGTMLLKHSVSSRLKSDEGMSLTEFTYQVFQAYDWFHLLKTYNCILQIGGNDQMGNILAGHEFISRVSNEEVFGITVPLITTSSGDKIGKSEGNAVWLNPNRTSPYQLYQYFLNIADADCEGYLNVFTFLTDKQIGEVMKKQTAKPETRIGQKTLAEQVTLLIHGAEGLTTAQRWTEAFFSKRIDLLAELTPEELSQLFDNAPTNTLLFEHGLTVADVCIKAGCFQREVDAQRVIKQGGVSINHCQITQPEFIITQGQHILENNITLIRLGKKRYFIIKWK